MTWPAQQTIIGRTNGEYLPVCSTNEHPSASLRPRPSSPPPATSPTSSARVERPRLTEAERRADAARYQEVRCRSALNRVEGMPFRWTLNPYRGCTHGCHYCFARRYHAQFEMDSGDEFASVILVKSNIAEVLRRELDRPAWQREQVALGTATDPYQPIEGHYRLTRASLELLARARTPVGLVTKGPMVVRDARCSARRGARVALRRLHERSHRRRRRVAHARAGHGASPSASAGGAGARRRRSLGRRADGANRPGLLLIARQARTHHQGDRRPWRALRGLQRHVPAGRHAHALHGVSRAGISRAAAALRAPLQKKYPPDAYRNDVKAMVELLQRRHGLGRRPEVHDEALDEPKTPEPGQGDFSW